MKRIQITMLLAMAFMVLVVPKSEAWDAARDLKRMIGYMIVDAAMIRSVTDDAVGGKVVVLDNGRVFKVQLLFIPPLPLTDVVIFGRRPEGSDTVVIKLLIGNDVYDAIPLTIAR